jgi:hypothetical protein
MSIKKANCMKEAKDGRVEKFIVHIEIFKPKK